MDAAALVDSSVLIPDTPALVEDVTRRSPLL